MSFKNFIDAYYTEEYLTSEFTFGFELEGFSDNLYKLSQIIEEHFGKGHAHIKDDSSLSNGTCRVCHGDGEEECDMCGGSGTKTCNNCNGDGQVACSECGGDGFITNADDEKKDCPDCDGTGTVECPDCGGDGNVTCQSCDGRGRYECSECNGSGSDPDGDDYEQVSGESFEWASPVFKCTPSDLEKVVKFFKAINENHLLNINESCGFHVHLGLPNEFQRAHDWFWILCHFAAGDITVQGKDSLAYFKDFNGREFFNDNYATYSQIREIRLLLERGDIGPLHYQEDKYNVFHIHPQGTLEWRGPRGFATRISLVKQFFLSFLPELTRFLAKAQHTNSVKTANGKTYTKKQIFDVIDAQAMMSTYNKKKKPYLSSFYTYSAECSQRLKQCIAIAGRWLTKAKGMSIKVMPTKDNSNVIFTSGYWEGGDFYGIFDGGGWNAPKEQMKGLFVRGYIGTPNDDVNAEEAAKYFGYNLEERIKQTKGAEQFLGDNK